MGPIKTHGPAVLAAIEVNDVNKVTDILTNKFRDKQKTKQFLVSDVRHSQSESTAVPLLAAAALDDPSILHFLVDKQGVDVNYVHEYGTEKHRKFENALTVAVSRGCCAMADVILTLGGDVNIQDHKGRTPLLHAVRRADRRMVRLLLSRGARIDIPDSEGVLPLHLASVYGHRELVGLLVSYGGDLCQGVQGSFSKGLTAVHIVAREGHAVLVRMFGELYRVDGNVLVQGDDGRFLAPIHVAAAEANADSIHALVEFCSADPNLKDSVGNAAIHCALLSGCNVALGTPTEDDLVETVRVLVNHRASINLGNSLGETPLHLAVRNGFPKVIEILIESGCDPTLTDYSGSRAVDLLMPGDEISRRLIMGAMGSSDNKIGLTAETEKTQNKSKALGMRSHKSGGNLHPQEPLAAASIPRPAVRKTKSVEHLDQDSENGFAHDKNTVPHPVARPPRVRSSSVQGPEVTDLNSSDVGKANVKKAVVPKKKKKEKILESEEQPESKLPVIKKKIKPGDSPMQFSESASHDQTVNSEEHGDTRGQAKAALPRVPRKAGTAKDSPEVQAKVEESKPSLQAWLDEQARLLKEKEKADHQGGPVAQSTPPTARSASSSKECLENSVNDSDGDANVLNQRAKLKPPPPPKPKVKKVSVSSSADPAARNADQLTRKADASAAPQDSHNLKEVHKSLLQRRDSQQSLTGVAQLGIDENSIDYENGSAVMKPLPSPTADTASSIANRLNMSLDSARSRLSSKENRPIPKSREKPSGVKPGYSSLVKRSEQEISVTSESELYFSGNNQKVAAAVAKLPANAQPRPVSLNKDFEKKSFPLAAQRKQPPLQEHPASRKGGTLVFEKAGAGTSPGRNFGKGRASATLPGDTVDFPNSPAKQIITISGASLSSSFEMLPLAEPTSGELSNQMSRNQQAKANVVVQSPEEEDDDEDDDDDDEEESSEESEDSEDEEEEEEEEESEEEGAPQTRNILNVSKSQGKNSGHQQVRGITFYNQDNPGFTVVGGNAEGLFVHAIDPGSDAARNGLANGDQILRANGQRIIGRTKEEATQMLQLLGGHLTLQVRSMPDQYRVVVGNGGIGDGFYVQAQFGYDAAKKGELNIRDGDIFSVTDTLPESNPGMWKTHKINARKNEEQIGMIPNRQKADQIAVKHRLSLSKSGPDQRGGAFFRSFRRSKSADRNGRNQDDDDKTMLPVTSAMVSYQRVAQKLSENRRPVVVLGLFCDIVISMLVRDSPELFETPQEEVENVKSSEEPVNVRLIRGSYHRGKHCLIILTPPSIEYLLQKTDFNPIVIYISPVSKSVIKAVKSKLAPNYNKNAGYMYDEAAKFEKTYSHMFSASVAYTTDDWWFFHLKEAIGRCQNQPIWRTLTEEEVEASAVAELNRICPGSAVVPSIPTRSSRDKTPRMARTTDDLPHQGPAAGTGRGKQLPPIPPTAGTREHNGRKVDGNDIQKERGDVAARSILKQRPTGGSVSSDQVSLNSGIPKNISVSFDGQEPSEIPHSISGKTSAAKSKVENPMGRETLL